MGTRGNGELVFKVLSTLVKPGNGVPKMVGSGAEGLRTAENSLNSGDYYGAFRLQQAVEKVLKALLISRGRVVRGHDIVELGYIIRDELHMDVSQIMDNLRELTAHYTTARYPDVANGVPYEIYTEGMARRILEKASEVVEWVRQICNRKSNNPTQEGLGVRE